MIELLANLVRGKSPLRLAAAQKRLAAAALMLLAVVAAAGYWRFGIAGATGATVAAGVCYASAALALTVTALGSTPQNPVAGLLLGMAIRTGVPLAAAIFLSRREGMFAEGGVFGWIVLAYLVMLAVETLLAVRLDRMAKIQTR